jgi:hypothetical protein
MALRDTRRCVPISTGCAHNFVAPQRDLEALASLSGMAAKYKHGVVAMLFCLPAAAPTGVYSATRHVRFLTFAKAVQRTSFRSILVG